MKTCPYCKEQVLDDATKCRYCQSSLALAKTDYGTGDTGGGQVTYIFDKDLIRFAKFSAAVLAIFVIVGAYLFGFKLEASVENIATLQKEVEAVSSDLKKSHAELQSAKASVIALKGEVESTLTQAKNIIGEIGKKKEEAEAILASYRELTPVQQQTLARVKASESGKSVGKWKYWAPGATIRIGFIGGTEQKKAIVRRVASEWLKYANLKFSFVGAGNAEVRVSFDPSGGSWSYLGTDALGVAKTEATMNLGWTERQNILHEFGHVLGLIEEHQNPDASIKWDVELLRKELGGPPNNWPESTIQERILKVTPREQLGEYRPFDPKSIMSYAFDPRLTGGTEVGGRSDLTDSDQKLVARIYAR